MEQMYGEQSERSSQNILDGEEKITVTIAMKDYMGTVDGDTEF